MMAGEEVSVSLIRDAVFKERIGVELTSGFPDGAAAPRLGQPP
jgi:hypothetical protein